jgi:hypothetical protein
MKIDPRRCSMLPVFAFRGVRHQMHEDTKPGLSPAERHKILGKLLDAICERERRKASYQRLREDPVYDASSGTDHTS